MLINRKDRWTEILARLKEGADYGIEKKRHIKNNVYVTILGRKMNIREASFLSGLPPEFYKKYQNNEVPKEDIMQKLDEQWMREKMNKLKQGLK